MTARLRPPGQAAAWSGRAVGASVALLALWCLALGTAMGRTGGTDDADPSTPASLGALASGPSPLALLGARASWLPNGLGEGRNRAAQLLAPGTPEVSGIGIGLRGTANAMSPRPPHLILLGLLAVRAPPASFA